MKGIKITLGKKKPKEKLCSKCNTKATYVEKYKRWYCTKCELYTEEEKTETLKAKTIHKDIPPPPQEETSLGTGTLEDRDPTKEDMIKQQKETDLDYYNKLYKDIDVNKDETTKLLYGVLAEVKTLNFQMAQLIQILTTPQGKE